MNEGRRTYLILAAVAVAAIVAPVGVRAAGNFVVLKDSNSASKAQIDNGKLRVGDGAGALNVAGKVGIKPSANKVEASTDPADPLAVEDVTPVPDRIQKYWFAQMGPGSSSTCASAYTVPSGKRLVVEYASATGSAQSGIDLYGAAITLDIDAAPNSVTVQIPLEEQAPNFFAGGTLAKAFAGPGSDVDICGSRTASTGTDTLQIGFSGYLEDAP